MKKLSMFAMLAVLVLGIAAAAQAADIKVSGKWQIEAQLRNNWDFTGHDEEQKFFIEQRMRTAFHFVANENLKAVLDTQIGSTNWGSGLYGIGAGRSVATNAAPTAGSAGNGNIMLRQGYLDFKLPGTQVRTTAGFQTVSLPAAFGGGSAIMDNQVAALVVSSPIMDGLAITSGYMRAVDVGTSSSSGNAYDAVFAALPITPKGFNITPFAAYAYVGKNANTAQTTTTGGFAGPNSSVGDGVRAYWGGVAFTMDAFQPFKVFADVNYGKATWNNNSNRGTNGGRSGWLFDLAVDYTGLSMMTPSAFFVYSTGEKGNATQGKTGGRMPVVANPQTWTVGSFFFGDKDFITRGSGTSDTTNENLGFWALGLSLKDIKLIDKVSHTATVLYAKGTNDPDYVVAQGQGNNGAVYGSMLTTKDSIWEVDFNTKYQMYNELALLLDLGYVNGNFHKDTWSKVSARYNTDAKDAYKAALSLTYAF